MSLVEIRRRYGVPATRGRWVEFEGRPAVITSARGHHLRLRFAHETRTCPGVFHPLWCMDYLDNVDHGAEYDRRVEAFFGSQPSPVGEER